MSGTPRKHTVIAILAATVGLGCVGSITFDSLRMIGEPFPGFFVWDNGVLPALHRTQWTGPQLSLIHI